jgi:DeoR family fructose operon transcriptional repressor
MTVWRDLKLLEEQGLLRRERGRVLSPENHSLESSFELKNPQMSDSKRLIARIAAREFVQEGDVIVLEGGTTVAALVDALPEQRISICTNSLPIGLRLREKRPALPTRVLGGWLSAVSGNTAGPDTLRELASSRFTTCFLSATAWDAEKGPMDPNPMEIEVKRSMAARADKVILLLDHTKFGQRSASVMIHCRRLHAVVTDRPPPPAVLQQLSRHGIKVLWKLRG